MRAKGWLHPRQSVSSPRHRQLRWEEVAGAKVVGEAVTGFGWLRSQWVDKMREFLVIGGKKQNRNSVE